MLCAEVMGYCAGKAARPFFYVPENGGYTAALHELSELGLPVIRTSAFCTDKDRFPDIDGLVSELESFTDNPAAVIGLGEFLALKGHTFTEKVLFRLKDIPARCVFLLRCITHDVRGMSAQDFRMSAQGRIFIGGGDGGMITVISCGKSGKNGVKSLLESLEDGAEGEFLTDTALSLRDSTLTVWDSPYDALRGFYGAFDVPRGLGTPEQWGRLLGEYVSHGRDIGGVLTSHGIDGAKFPDDDYERWLLFVSLRQNPDGSYPSYAASLTDDPGNFSDGIITSINNIPPDSPSYPEYYAQRKEIIRRFHEGEISRFIPHLNTQSLTDTTIHERQEIISRISHDGLTDEIRTVYPALWAYSGAYDLGHDWMNEYFSRYRLQKLANMAEPGFEALAVRYAGGEVQKADTRDNVIRSLNDGDTFLLWIDALGIEFVPLMKYLAGTNGLSARITVTRANIPTITRMNREFFDAWPPGMKDKESRLDSIKHEESAKDSASYLAGEIDVITGAFTRAKLSLARGDFRRFIITGDHGASRLAVISGHDVKYGCGGKPEHSGRCCEYFAGCEVVHTITENGYIALTDYGGFSGGRISGRELHGGATPEEILTPVCVLERAKSRGKPAEVRGEFEDVFAV